jgi:sirohydrochlorin ferrochelatase
MLGVAHGGVDDQRQEDDAAEIVVEPLLVAKALEIQRDRRRVPPNTDTVIA